MKKIVLYFDPAPQKIFIETADETGEKKIGLSTLNNFVYTSEIVARVIEFDSEEQIKTRLDPGYPYYHIIDFIPLKAGEGIVFDQTAGAYKASAYGFAIFDGKMLKLLSPITIPKNKIKAFMNVCPTQQGKIPTIADIQEWMQHYKILAGVGEKKLAEQLQEINPEEKKLTRIVVAQGRETVQGHEEYFIPLLNVDKKAGEIMADGRIDFKETGSIIQVVKDQELLERVPEVKPVDGYNIFGDKVLADTEEHNGFYRGENIVQSGHSDKIFLSAIDGCLEINKKTISVLPVAVIQGDVNYETGNIDFNGSVHIKGSVLAGFSVKAAADIIIENSVEDALIEAQGDVTVKMGVVGKEQVKVVSGGSVTAKYLLNAKVEAAKDIMVEDSIINCDVFANNAIVVVAKNGKIIGGKSTALYEIISNVSGAPNETPTNLSVGRNLFIEQELLANHKEISRCREEVEETMRKLKVSFGEGVFEDPKKYIGMLPSIKKKNCLILLKELSSGNKMLKELIEKNKEIQDKLKLERDPSITIREKTFPGTVLSIKKSVRKIENIVENAKYYEDPTDKVIRFTSAV
ncbi:MAG TPA: FapA family protein [Spirochaetota bacterium]|nr:FapA family protein [Spirochaetota bacterium]HPI90155.1 FapA family protein [Spirochaetota bacterium]HPR48914.1 FapA family protein [Spirochaetota bacterium]